MASESKDTEDSESKDTEDWQAGFRSGKQAAAFLIRRQAADRFLSAMDREAIALRALAGEVEEIEVPW